MSTMCVIGVEQPDGTVKGITCWRDGQLENAGRLLQRYYNTEELASALVALGDISSLEKKLNPTGPHTFYDPETNVTVAYHRDRGLDLRIDTWRSAEDFYHNEHESEFNYLFSQGEWFWNEKQLTKYV